MFSMKTRTKKGRHGRTGLAASLAGLLLSQAALAAGDTPPAELVVRNGAIYTVDPRQPWVEALAIRDGRFVFAGSNAQAAGYIGPRTEVVDLAGAMAMPGINDVHAHPLEGGYEDLFSCNFPGQSTLAQVLERVAACVRQAEPGEWIVGAAWGSTLMPELATAAALAALDRASGGHPVVLRDDSYHNRWANSEALRRAGITAASADPEGGVIVKDPASGAPTGLLKEFPAFQALLQLVPPPTQGRRLAAGKAAARTMASLGITSVQEAVSSEVNLKVWSSLDRGEGLPLRILGSIVSAPLLDDGRAGLELVAERDAYRTPNFRPDLFKFMLDGVPPAHTAKFIEPYLPDAAHGDHFHGETHYTLEQLTETLAQVDKRGMPAKMHAAGDGSLRMALDAVAAVRARNGDRGPVHQIAHAIFVSPQDLPRFAELRVAADLSPMLWFPSGLAQAVGDVVGEARMKSFVPTVKLIEAGALVAAGSDWPAGGPTPNPWIGIEGLVTRKNPLGEVPGTLAPDQAVDLAEALRIYTLNSARAMAVDGETGSIEAGKSADFIVLDRHLFRVPIEQVHGTQVLRTYYKGRPVHLATGTAAGT